MGLAVSTDYLADMLENDAEGAEWFRANLEIVNSFLVEAGLPTHVESERRGMARPRAHCASFPYSFLHYLRRAFAHVREYPDRALQPVPADADPAADPVVEDAATMMNTHLLCHSDCEGFYVPQEFDDVIFDVDGRGLPGGMLGSSQRLLAELVEVAPALGIALDGGKLTDKRAAELAEEEEADSPFWRERLVWLALFENARTSIANRTLLVFG
jgi:hypothetical protein